jgi:hypothetical protein
MHIIAKHLDRSLIEDKITSNISTVCLFTGLVITEGVHREKIISTRFTDTEYLRYPSDYLSIDAALCISPVIRAEKGYNSLRNYSYIATENELNILKRENILQIILSPPTPPFCLAVTFSNKKHTAYKTIPAADRKSFMITTDKGTVHIDVTTVASVVDLIQKWYTIVPGKEENSMQPTWFTKDEILFGSKNFKRIMDYGEEAYYSENKLIDKYRYSLFLTLIVHLLNKAKC